MPSWLALALAALVVWGACFPFFNPTSRHIGSYSAIVWEVLCNLIVVALVCLGLLRRSSIESDGRGALFGMATGVAHTVGLLPAFAALSAWLKPE